MATRTPHVLASATLGLILLASSGAPLQAAAAEEMDFAAAKAKAAADDKLVLIDFSSPT